MMKHRGGMTTRIGEEEGYWVGSFFLLFISLCIEEETLSYEN